MLGVIGSIPWRHESVIAEGSVPHAFGKVDDQAWDLHAALSLLTPWGWCHAERHTRGPARVRAETTTGLTALA